MANAGAVRVEGASTLRVTGADYTQSGGVTELVDPASTLDATTRRVVLTGGVLRGRGTIVASGAPGLRNGATVDVGAPGAIGSLAVTGSVTQTVDGTLLLDVGGSGATAHDLLTVSGAATLGGTLSLRLDPAWSPSEGDSVKIGRAHV